MKWEICTSSHQNSHKNSHQNSHQILMREWKRSERYAQALGVTTQPPRSPTAGVIFFAKPEAPLIPHLKMASYNIGHPLLKLNYIYYDFVQESRPECTESSWCDVTVTPLICDPSGPQWIQWSTSITQLYPHCIASSSSFHALASFMAPRGRPVHYIINKHKQPLRATMPPVIWCRRFICFLPAAPGSL